MNILIDIVHPADVSFYQETVRTLLGQGHHITMTVMKRGNLQTLVRKEFPDCTVLPLGRHHSTLLGKIAGILTREISFLALYTRKRYDVVTGFGFYAGMLSPLFRMPSIHIHDDKEYKINYTLTKTFCTRFISLCPTKKNRKTLILNSYKELAYLKKPEKDPSILNKLNIRAKAYIYVRDISPVSLNYREEASDFTGLFEHLRKRGYTVIYHPEDKRHEYAKTIKLTELLTRGQLNALIGQAALVITSGDTVLREAVLLGTPTIYTSTRDMSINKEFERQGLFARANTGTITGKADQLLAEKRTRKTLDAYISGLQDINEILLGEINKHGTKNKEPAPHRRQRPKK